MSLCHCEELKRRGDAKSRSLQLSIASRGLGARLRRDPVGSHSNDGGDAMRSLFHLTLGFHEAVVSKGEANSQAVHPSRRALCQHR